MKPSIFIAMPCYDSVKINTMKSPLIHQARNYLTSVFLTTDYTHLLFIDSDVEFGPEAGLHMLVADKDIICTPYRVKNDHLEKSLYTVKFPNPKSIPILPGKLVEIEAGPTGLMLIHRRVFEKIIKNRPDLKIKNPVSQGLVSTEKSHSFYYNFFDFAFEDGYTMGEDVSFCKLARDNDFKLYANTDSPTAHHGSFAWKGTFGKSMKEK